VHHEQLSGVIHHAEVRVLRGMTTTARRRRLGALGLVLCVGAGAGCTSGASRHVSSLPATQPSSVRTVQPSTKASGPTARAGFGDWLDSHFGSRIGVLARGATATAVVVPMLSPSAADVASVQDAASRFGLTARVTVSVASRRELDALVASVSRAVEALGVKDAWAVGIDGSSGRVELTFTSSTDKRAIEAAAFGAVDRFLRAANARDPSRALTRADVFAVSAGHISLLAG